MNDNKINTEDKKFHKKFVYVFCILAYIAILLIVIADVVIAACWGLKGTSCESTLLSTGLGIIGLAISVWGGLNIASTLNLKELEVLKKDIEQLKGQTDLEIRPFVEQNRAALLQQLIVELERKQEDPIAQYFLKQFRAIPSTETNIPYVMLIEIETLITQVALRHRSGYKYDETLIKLADEGLNRIEKIQDCDQVKQYLIYRKADFMFYKGYCDKDRVESAKDFMNTTKILITELSYDSLKEDFRSDDRAAAYLDNMLGEAYSKIVHYYTDVFGKEEGAKLEQFLEREMCQIDNIADAAIKYCEAAVSHLATSVYCRDLGCAYERKDRLIERSGGEAYAHSAKIIEIYSKSITLTLNDYTIDHETSRNAFYVVLSYYKRYLSNEFKNSKCLLSTYEECAEHISKMYIHAYIATRDFPRSMVFHKLYAFACHYVCQALTLNITIVAACGRSEKYFKRQIKNTLNLLEFVDTEVGKADDFTKELTAICRQ